jgi:hypothetical protein
MPTKTHFIRISLIVLGMIGIRIYDHAVRFHPAHTLTGILLYWLIAIISLWLIFWGGLWNMFRKNVH